MRKKILVLDDKIAIAKVLSIYLASDYDCIWLPNGIEGVKWLQEGNIPDLIISDIRMPEMRGDEFLESAGYKKARKTILSILSIPWS